MVLASCMQRNATGAGPVRSMYGLQVRVGAAGQLIMRFVQYG